MPNYVDKLTDGTMFYVVSVSYYSALKQSNVFSLLEFPRVAHPPHWRTKNSSANDSENVTYNIFRSIWEKHISGILTARYAVG